MRQTHKPFLWSVLSPAAFALVPVLRPLMRGTALRPLRRWLYRAFLDPYTNALQQAVDVTTVFGCLLHGTLGGLVQRSVFHFGLFEPTLTAWLSQRLRPGDTFVDVGANVGYFSLLASKLVGPTGHVVALEPAPSTFAALRRNLEINGATNVRAVEMAAYDREAPMPIFHLPEEEFTGGASLVRTIGPREADVAAAPLATILTADEVRGARLIKIDVEGAEVYAVKGLLSLIPQLPSDAELVVEVMPENAEPVRSLIEAQGFRTFVLDNPTDPLGRIARERARPRRLAAGASARNAVSPGEAVGYLVFSRLDASTL